MTLPIIAIAAGLVLLIWSADRFVDGAAFSARQFGVPPLLIGMLVVGFGTSMPEIVVSVIAALQGNPGLAVGNAYGSNITNIALILGVSALVSPLAVHSKVIRRELPILALVTAFATALLWDREISRVDGLLLLTAFAGIVGWSIYAGTREGRDELAEDVEQEFPGPPRSITRALFWVFAGLILLVVSSRLLVWGSVEIAKGLGVSDLVIGLTIVALGTSLPELASSVLAARKGENDLAIGNVLGSNLFNTLAVVGLSASILPISIGPEVIYRDVLAMSVLTVSLFIFGYGFRRQGRINRYEGSVLLVCYVFYTAYLLITSFR